MNDMQSAPPTTASLSDAGGRSPGDLPLLAPFDAEQKIALFLDFDGTLVEIADHPGGVVVAPYLPALIAALSRRLEERMAIVTGRSIAALEELLGPIPVAVAGSHGGEFRRGASAACGGHADGKIEALSEPLPSDVVSVLEDFAVANGGLLVEPKPFSVAVHYRQHPEAMEPLLACAEGLASAHGLSLKHGKQVIELAVPGSDKGTAVARFMTLPPFAGATPLFLGDDVTDEDAFHAVTPLGGQGVLVGPMRPTAARSRLPGVAAVHQWLESVLEGDFHP